MAEAVEVKGGAALIDDTADADDAATANGMKGDAFVFRISGALFFGATVGVSTILDRIGEHPRVFILDFSAVPLIDSTGARSLHGFVHKLQRSGTRIYFSGAEDSVRRSLINAGLKPPDVAYSDNIESAKAAARQASS